MKNLEEEAKKMWEGLKDLYISYEDVEQSIEDCDKWELLQYFRTELNIESDIDDIEEWSNDIEEFLSVHFENNPKEAINCAIYGDYNAQDDYIKFDGYGNLKTCSTDELEQEIEELFDNNKEQITRLAIKEGYTAEAEQFNELQEYINELQKPYLQLKEEQRKEQEQLPYGFAFSNKQFEEMMQKWELDAEKDTQKIISIGCGAYIQKKDIEEVEQKNKEHHENMKKLLNKASNLLGALVYEMGNHELIYNYQLDFDICNCFGWTKKQFEKVKSIYKLAYTIEYNFEKRFI